MPATGKPPSDSVRRTPDNEASESVKLRLFPFFIQYIKARLKRPASQGK
jgi:hypothetical protein